MDDYIIRLDASANIATVLYRGEEVWQSRPTRLLVQAERLAKDWILESMGENNGDITLEVQDLEVDPSSWFGGN